jgi:hypothetical protein
MYAYSRQPAERLTFQLSFAKWCCVVGGCDHPVIAEIFAEDYKATVEAMGFRCDQKRPNRLSGHPRIGVCANHIDDGLVSAALNHPRWQVLLMPMQ